MASPTVDKCQYDIMHMIRNSFLSQNYHYSNYWDVAAVDTVSNLDLEEQYQEKRRDLIHTGRTKDELTETLLMGCYIRDEDVKFISLNGLQCRKHGTMSYLGNGTKGVTLGKHADILLKSFYNDGYEQCWIVVYKVVYGRQKEVLHIQTPPYREPMQDADCHVSLLAPAPTEDCLFIQEIKSQVFLFDKDEKGEFLRRPRQCVPIACVKFKRASPIGAETMVANRTASEISDAAIRKDSFTLLRDSLAKMKESFVVPSKETVISSKTNHANRSSSKVSVNSTGHRNLQQQENEMNERTIKGETQRKDELDKNKLTVSVETEHRPKTEIDLCSRGDADVKPSDVELSRGVESKSCNKKVSQRQREISKDGKLKQASFAVSIHGDLPITPSTPLKAASMVSGKTEETELTRTKKCGQLFKPPVAAPRAVDEGKGEPFIVASSAAAVSQSNWRDIKYLSRRGIAPGSATNGKQVISRTERKQQDAGSRVMSGVSNRKTCLIEALPVSSSSCPSLTSAFSRQPSLVTACNGVPKPGKPTLASTVSTVRNGLPVSTNIPSASGLQNCSNISACSTTAASVMQKQSNCVSEAPPEKVIRLAHTVPKQASNVCQKSSDLASISQEHMTLNSNCYAQNKQPTSGDEGGKPLFQALTSSPLNAKTVSIFNTTTYSTSTVKSNVKIPSKTCLATSLNPTSIDSTSKWQNSSSLLTELTSIFVSQSKPSVFPQTSGTSDTQPTQLQVTRAVPSNHNSLHLPLRVKKTSHKAETNLATLVPAKTSNGPVSSAQNQTKSGSIKRTCTSLKTGTDSVSPLASSFSTTEKRRHSANPSRSILPPRKTTQSKTIQSTNRESRFTSQPQTASPLPNGIFASPCSSPEANRAIYMHHSTNSSPTLKESVAKPIFKSHSENCFTKDSDRSKFNTNFSDIQFQASSDAISQKKLLLLQHGFISGLTKQLASDLNDVANLLRASKPEKANQPEKQALLSLREINSKFTELTPMCIQYKQVFRLVKNGHSVRLPELDQLNSQERTMNECCSILGKVFSKLKTSQLKSETVSQKRSLAITWLADSKNELISCINNIKSIVENVVLTCELSSVPTNTTLQSTTETNCVGNSQTLQTEKDHKAIGSSSATRDVAKDKQCLAVCCQVTEVIATVGSSQHDQTSKIHVTTEAKQQLFPENNDTATVTNVEHLVNFDQGQSENVESSGATIENAEIMLHFGNCFGDEKEPDKDRKSKPFQGEIQNRSDETVNVMAEGYAEQNGKEREPETTEYPSISSVEKRSQSEDDKRVERGKSHSSAVCRGRLSRNSCKSDNVHILMEDVSLSVQHASTLAADITNDSTDVAQLIKTEHDDPRNLIAWPPQTIIFDADDFIPPSNPSPSGYNSSSVLSASTDSKGFNNNNSLSMGVSCNIENCASGRLQDGAQELGDSRYESCVTLEPESSTLSWDGVDEIPPLLTPDCAFGLSSIVYNVKSDEPPMLEANTDESWKNTENVLSTLYVTPTDTSTLCVTQRDSSTLGVTPRNLSRDSPDMVLHISGTRASTIIMNSDDMVASNSTASETKSETDLQCVDIDARVCKNLKPQVERDVSTDIQMKESLRDKSQLSVAKGTDEENDKSEEIYYVRVVGELTRTDSMTTDREIVAQSSGRCQNQSKDDSTTKTMPDNLQQIHDDSKENVYAITDPVSYQEVKSDQLERPDDTPKTVLGIQLQPFSSQSVIIHDSSVTDSWKPTLNSEQIQPKSDKTSADMEFLCTSIPRYSEAYAAMLSSVRNWPSNQSQYVFKIEPDDDFDPDSVCSCESLNAQKQPSESARQVLLEVSTSRDGQVSQQGHELGFSKAVDAVSLPDRNTANESHLSSNSSAETLETVGNKSPHLRGERETVSKQSSQEHPNENSTVRLSSEPPEFDHQTGGCSLRESPSESVTVETSAVFNSSKEVNSLPEVQHMPERSFPVTQEYSCGRRTLSDDRCGSPPTVYTEPPQSPPPEPIPLTAVIKQEITLLENDIEMKKDLKERTRRKRKRENKPHEEPIVFISDENGESGCSAPPQKQRSADWSFKLYSQTADRELRDSVARFVEFCSSDVYQSASIKAFRVESDRHHNKAIQDSDAAGAGVTAACEEKMMDERDMIRSKSASKWLSSMYSERKIENEGKANDERGFRSEEKDRLWRCNSRNLSYDRNSVSSGSRFSQNRIKDVGLHAERQTERRLSRDSERRRTIYHGSHDHKEHRSTRSHSGSHGSLRERRYSYERSKEPPIEQRSPEKGPTSRRPNIDATSREPCRRSDGRSDYRSRTTRCSRAEYEDRKMRSRSTRPLAASMPSFETRAYDIKKDPSGHLDHSWRKVLDPSTLKRQFWSKGHPRFRCHDGCEPGCVAVVHASQDADKHHSCETNQRAGNSPLVHEKEILEETLKLNIEMLESSRNKDRTMESPKDEKTAFARTGTKRPLLKTSDGIATRHRKNDDDDDDDEAKEEALDDHPSTTSSRRSKTLSRQDQDSDRDDRVSRGLRTNYDEVDVTDRYCPKKMTSVAADATEGEALQPLTSGRSSVASGCGSEEGRISRQFCDDKTPSHGGISAIRMSKSTQRACQVSASAAATTKPAIARAPVSLSRTSITYVTEVLQTSNFSTQVCFEKYKKVVD